MGSSILKYGIVMLFMFSTVYTMAFYWYQAEGINMEGAGVNDAFQKFSIDPDGELRQTPEAQKSFITIVVDNMLFFVLESLSWFSPFALVKLLFVIIVPAPIYEPLNLLILRPLGWIGTWITTEWIINKIRGGSET